MAISVRPGGRYEVFVYDPLIRRKRYVGCFDSEELARAAEQEHKANIADGVTRRCPGCRKRFRPDDEWQVRCSERCELNIKRRGERKRARRPDNHWVYTCLNTAMEVIYVGVTSTGLRRHREHGRETQWWGEVAFMKVDHFATREEALAAETAGITQHQPRHNRIGVVREGRDVAENG